MVYSIAERVEILCIKRCTGKPVQHWLYSRISSKIKTHSVTNRKWNIENPVRDGAVEVAVLG